MKPQKFKLLIFRNNRIWPIKGFLIFFWISNQLSIKNMFLVFGAQKKRLGETFLLGTNNRCLIR